MPNLHEQFLFLIRFLRVKTKHLTEFFLDKSSGSKVSVGNLRAFERKIMGLIRAVRLPFSVLPATLIAMNTKEQ